MLPTIYRTSYARVKYVTRTLATLTCSVVVLQRESFVANFALETCLVVSATIHAQPLHRIYGLTANLREGQHNEQQN